MKQIVHFLFGPLAARMKGIALPTHNIPISYFHLALPVPALQIKCIYILALICSFWPGLYFPRDNPKQLPSELEPWEHSISDLEADWVCILVEGLVTGTYTHQPLYPLFQFFWDRQLWNGSEPSRHNSTRYE